MDTPGIIPTKQDDQIQAAKLDLSSVSENAYSPEPVAQALLDMLVAGKYKEQVLIYYKVDELTLYAIAKSRNWILKADSLDTERTAKYIL